MKLIECDKAREKSRRKVFRLNVTKDNEFSQCIYERQREIRYQFVNLNQFLYITLRPLKDLYYLINNLLEIVISSQRLRRVRKNPLTLYRSNAESLK